MTPLDVILGTLPAAVVSAIVLGATWRWRTAQWPVPVALGLGYAASHAWVRGVPALNPVDSTEFVFHIALGAAIVGAFRLPGKFAWPLRVLVSAAVAWLMLRNLVANVWTETGERVLWLGSTTAALFLGWAAVSWRAARVPGWSMPAILVIVAAGGSGALVLGHGAALGEMAGMLAAATGPLLLYGWLRRDATFDVTPFVLIAGALWIAGYFFADLPAPSALLLMAAPVAAQRKRGWLGIVIAVVIVGAAVGWAHFANLPDPDDPYAEYY